MCKFLLYISSCYSQWKSSQVNASLGSTDIWLWCCLPQSLPIAVAGKGNSPYPSFILSLPESWRRSRCSRTQHSVGPNTLDSCFAWMDLKWLAPLLPKSLWSVFKEFFAKIIFGKFHGTWRFAVWPMLLSLDLCNCSSFGMMIKKWKSKRKFPLTWVISVYHLTSHEVIISN